MMHAKNTLVRFSPTELAGLKSLAAVDPGVVGARTVHVSGLDKAFRTCSERCPKPLYRGLGPSEIRDQGKYFVTKSYVVLTENVDEAKRWAKRLGTNVVLRLDGAVAFCYWKWFKNYCADANDLDDAAGRVRERAEWYVNRHVKFLTEDVAPGEAELRGYEVLKCRLASSRPTPREVLDHVRPEHRADDPTVLSETARIARVRDGVVIEGVLRGTRLRDLPLVRESSADQEEQLRRAGVVSTTTREIPHDGWVERHETWVMEGNPPVDLVNGYTPDGHWIGDADEAKFLVEQRGIRPEKIDPEHSVCSVGYVPSTNEWAGWSHRAICTFPSRLEAVKFAESVASEITTTSGLGTSMTKRSAETGSAGDVEATVPTNDLLLDGTDVLRKYDSMLTRRRNAAMCGQPRVAQRLDKQINILRAALGMKPLAPIKVRTSGQSFDQNVDPDQVDYADPWDRTWMERSTTQCLRTWCRGMQRRGFAVERRVVDGRAHEWIATGSDRTGPVKYSITVLDNKWCTGVSKNGERLPLFEFGSDGVPAEMASEGWGGRVSGRDAQQYLSSWSRLVRGEF